jgi:hypothetical protein
MSCSLECDPDPILAPPFHDTWPGGLVHRNQQVEKLRYADRASYLKASSRIGQIPNRTIDNGSLVIENDLPGLQ